MKPGRPKLENGKETVRVIHVSLDAETAEALKILESRERSGMRRGKVSLVVRKAIVAAATRLD